MEYYVLGTGIVFIFLAFSAALWLRHCLVKYTNSLTSSLDEMIAGKQEIIFDEESELLMGKIQVKLRQLYEMMRRQADKNEKDRENLEEIISDISHQVKTPIANIRMYHTILQKGNFPPERGKEFLGAADIQVEKLNSLMTSMVEMSRMEVGTIRVLPVYQSVYPLIEQAVCSAALKAEKKDIRIEIECGKAICAVFDLKWTVEALGNILDNAVKYTEQGGLISIKAGATDYFVKIEVKDCGRGICEEDYTKIFKRFYRGKDARQEEGVGIGLFLAQEILRKQRGYISVQSEVRKGSSFFLHLPAEE